MNVALLTSTTVLGWAKRLIQPWCAILLEILVFVFDARTSTPVGVFSLSIKRLSGRCKGQSEQSFPLTLSLEFS